VSQYIGLNFPLASFILAAATPRPQLKRRRDALPFIRFSDGSPPMSVRLTLIVVTSTNERPLNIGDVIFADIAAAMIFGDDYL